MLILALKTNDPEAELLLLRGNTVLAQKSWQAHKALSDTLHRTVQQLLQDANYTVRDIEGLIVHKGPGSFTGIRIGIAYAQALALAHEIPLVGVSGATWVTQGVQKLEQGDNEDTVVPDYGADARTTQPRK